MLFASGISLSQKTPLCESTLCVLGLGLVLGWVWSATVIPAEGQRRTQVSAMAVICVRGGGHQCPPDKKGHKPTGVGTPQPVQFPKGKGKARGLGLAFRFWTRFRCDRRGVGVPPLDLCRRF